MAVAVIGGAGFLGSHIVDELLVQGFEVSVIDDLKNGSLDNLHRWKGNPKLEFVRGEYTDEYLVRAICDHKSWVFCAINSFNQNILNACKEREVKRIIFNIPSQAEIIPQSDEVVFIHIPEGVYGPRRPFKDGREETLFVSDVVRANMLAVMNYDAKGFYSLDPVLSVETRTLENLGWKPLIDLETGKEVTRRYEEVNRSSILIVGR